MTTSINLCAIVDALFMGQVKDRWAGKPPSAIQKDLVSGPQIITNTGFANDAQADLKVHGGKDKAIHHYAFDHYAAWHNEGEIGSDEQPGAFGENVSTTGMTEDNLCIGDILRLGSATVQISQGRQPCWKLGAHTGNEKMPYLFQKTGRTGWYYRVLETGSVSAGDQITLIERPQPDWSVRKVTLARLSKRIPAHEAAILAETEELAEGWRSAFARMAAGNTYEDTSARLNAN